jgi:drug/metabolite transporter (DMT)-like permease
MNEDIGQADALVTQAERFFAAHPVAKWLVLAWVFGWVIAFIVRPFIRLSPLPDKIESHLVLLSCIGASAGAAWAMWGAQDHAVIVATIMGGTSPFGYLLAAWLLCWKWPALKPHLSLQKDFAAAVDDEKDINTPSGDGQ